MKGERKVKLLNIWSHYIAQVIAVYHLPQICTVGDAGYASFREMLPHKRGQQKQVVADDEIRIEVGYSAADRIDERVFKLRDHIRSKIAVSCRCIRHDIRHADDRERQGAEPCRGSLARRREQIGLFVSKKDRIAGDTLREVYDVIRKDAADDCLSVALAGKSFYKLGHVCAAAGGMRLLCCYT